jgi:hypothetical protein
MHQINRLSSLFRVVSLSLLIAVSTPSLFGLLPVNQPAQALSLSQLRQSWEADWRNLFGNNRPVPPVPPKGGGSRPSKEGICPIAPVAESETNSSILTPAVVWSDRPTFVWKGKVETIAVRLRGSEDMLWMQDVSGSNQVTYTGNTLQPDQVYEWLMLSSNNQVKRFIPFRVVTAQERDRISQSLQQLDQQLVAEGITGEAATLRRAEFFATQRIDNQPLWSEFWQEVLSVQTPSDKLMAWTRETMTLMCNPNNTTVGTPVQ